MIDELASLTDEPGRLTRLYLSPAHRNAAGCLAAWMRDAGMLAHIDAIGNVIGRYEGLLPDAPALLLGSHIDTVRDAGKYDGILGVVSALAVVGRLHAAGKRLPHAIEVVAFGDEEGVRFASTLGGSSALAGVFDLKLLDDCDRDGISRRQALMDFGCNPAHIPSVARDPAQVLGYVELHIEQGPVLEAENLPMAVVTAINGGTRATVDVRGNRGHAGTVPMALRHDALAAAAEMILAVEQRARGNADLVGTVGRLDIANAATNTVPGSVTWTFDVRSPSDAERHTAVADIERQIATIARARRVETAVTITYNTPAATSDAGLSQHLAASISRQGHPVRRMPSGAGHDAMSFRGRIPFTMLFVRCRGGISHHPAEHASVADIEIAARILTDFVETFDAGL